MKAKNESAEQIAQRGIQKALNKDWKRQYKIRSVRNLEISSGGKLFHGRYILIEFTEPLAGDSGLSGCSFVGGFILNVPAIYLDQPYPVLFYAGDTWENGEERLFLDGKAKAQYHADCCKCPYCGSYKPPRITRKSGGEELVWITSTCKDCGHKEVDPLD